MKTIKRSIAFMLALILTFAMSVTAFADEAKTYSITIDSAIPGHTYEAYQIFTGDLSEDETTLSNIKWGEGISKDGQKTLGSAKDYAEALAKIESNSDKATTEAEKRDKATAEAEKLNGYLEKASQTVSVPADSTDVNYKLTGLKAGYYLIKDKDDSLSGSDKSYTEFILKLVKDQTVKPKSGTTTVEKKVKDINDTTDKAGNYKDKDWQDSADYDIGDPVPFRLQATLAENVSAYDTYYLNFHDTLSDGLTYNEDYTVSVDGVEIDKNAFTANYDASSNSLSFECADIKKYDATNSSIVTIEYTAKLNDKAVIGSAGNKNEVTLEFSNNPNSEGDGDHGTTPKDTVIVFTYKVIINKIDAEKKPLTGAAFELYKKLKNGDETKIAYKEIGDDDTTQFSFEGLDDGQYRLHESKTPDGYNTIIDDITFTVTADHDVIIDEALANGNSPLTDLNGNKVTGEIKFTKSVDEGSLTAGIVNQKGSVLPSTGGAGRVAIYVVGGVLLVGAGILLVTKKRVR